MKIYLLILGVLIILIILFDLLQNQREPANELAIVNPSISPDLGPATVKYPHDYTLVLVGDSMTQALGNCDELKDFLVKFYVEKSFECLNYGFGSTNILSLQDRLEKETFFNRSFRPITHIDFELILLESFGHNPLSEYSLEEGLKKHTESLNKAILTLRETNPRAKVVFIATLAPSKKYYAQNQRELSQTEREKWAEERIAYIQNHISFAKNNNIPLINVFEKSLKGSDVNLEYISKNDYIHPSPKGVIFISRQIANFIYQNKVLEEAR